MSRCELCGEKEPCRRCSGIPTYKAMVTFETKSDYDNFLVIMSIAAEDNRIASPFNIQRFVVKHDHG